MVSEACVKSEVKKIPYFFTNKEYLLTFALDSTFYKDRGFKKCKIGLYSYTIDEARPLQRAAGTYLAPSS
jgi:hypothetical protein